MKKLRGVIGRVPNIFKRRWGGILLLCIIAVAFFWYPGQSRYMIDFFPQNLKTQAKMIVVPTPPPYPVNITQIYPGEEISALAVVVQDLTSGVYIYRKNSTIKLPPASTTKILTALVVLDSMNLNDVVTVSDTKNGGQVMGLVHGERITVENLLYGLLIQSGNDAGYALAAQYPGGVDAFVASMNAKAQELHLSSSHFTNPVGYDDPEHYMSAEDLTKLAAVALENSVIAKMVSIPQITVSDVTHTYFHKLSNVNQLLGKIPGIAGIKTGWTEEAGENLVTLMERNGRRVIIVVLHSGDRFMDTIRLIDWTFANIQWQEMLQK